MFRGVHILPPFPSSGDRGFAPLTYDRIDPRFGTWDDVRRIAARHDVLLDLMINHISRQSQEFQDFQRHGRRSESADLFITHRQGLARRRPCARRRRRDLPAQAAHPVLECDDRGHGQAGAGLDVVRIGRLVRADRPRRHVAGDRTLITRWLRTFAERGVGIVRLDAVGYVIKKPGTTCFMVEPEIYEFLEWIADVADSFGLAILPEVHDAHATHERLSAHGFWTYDFVLPGLLLHAFATGEARRLAEHLARSPDRQFTNLDCHDGIPVRPDLDGILTPSRWPSWRSGSARRAGT